MPMDDIIGEMAEQALQRGGVLGMDEDSVLGYEEDVLGALGGRAASFPFGGGRRKSRMILPGVQRPGERRQWIPFGRATFNLASVLTPQTLTVNPQRPFRGQRIVAAVARIGATSNALVTMTQLLIGNTPQPLLAGDTPIEAFQADANGLEVDLDSSQPGVTYTITLQNATAVTTTDSITVSIAIFGMSIS